MKAAKKPPSTDYLKKPHRYRCVDGPATHLYLPWPHETEKPVLPAHVNYPGQGRYVRQFDPEGSYWFQWESE